MDQWLFMKITKGEYCQFSLHGKLQLLDEFGELLCEKSYESRSIRLFRLCDFYVEVMFNKVNSITERAEPIKSFHQFLFYYR